MQLCVVFFKYQMVELQVLRRLAKPLDVLTRKTLIEIVDIISTHHFMMQRFFMHIFRELIYSRAIIEQHESRE